MTDEGPSLPLEETGNEFWLPGGFVDQEASADSAANKDAA
jgi:hypothetical protein